MPKGQKAFELVFFGSHFGSASHQTEEIPQQNDLRKSYKSSGLHFSTANGPEDRIPSQRETKQTLWPSLFLYNHSPRMPKSRLSVGIFAQQPNDQTMQTFHTNQLPCIESKMHVCFWGEGKRPSREMMWKEFQTNSVSGSCRIDSHKCDWRSRLSFMTIGHVRTFYFGWYTAAE